MRADAPPAEARPGRNRGIAGGLNEQHEALGDSHLCGRGRVLAAPAAASPRFGVVNQGLLSEADFQNMDDGGVQTLRFLVRWQVVEPEPGAYDWSRIDSVVAGAQAHGIKLLPCALRLAGLDRRQREPRAARRPPPSALHGSAFLTAMAARYGPGGSFFAGGPEAPIRRWQIWNEPNFDVYWEPPHPASAYGRLVEISAQALRAVDPHAKIVLAGVAAVHDGVPWAGFLRRPLCGPRHQAQLRLRRLSPLLAEHPDPARPDRTDATAAHAGSATAAPASRSPRSAGPPTGSRPRPLVVGPNEQAVCCAAPSPLLSKPGRGWHISDVQWYAWQDSHAIEDGCVFCEYAGLFDSFGQPKAPWACLSASGQRSEAEREPRSRRSTLYAAARQQTFA